MLSCQASTDSSTVAVATDVTTAAATAAPAPEMTTSTSGSQHLQAAGFFTALVILAARAL